MAWRKKVRGHFILYAIPFSHMRIEDVNKRWAFNKLTWIASDPDLLNDKLKSVAGADAVVMFPFIAHEMLERKDDKTLIRVELPTTKGYLLYATYYRDILLGPHAEWDGERWVSYEGYYDEEQGKWIKTEEYIPESQEERERWEKYERVRKEIDRFYEMIFVPHGGDINTPLKGIMKSACDVRIIDVEILDQFVIDAGNQIERREILGADGQ